MIRLLISAIVAGTFIFTQNVVADDNNSTVNIVHPIDHTEYPHPNPEPLRSYMQTFSIGATCRDGGAVTYRLEGNTQFEGKQEFYGHLSLQFGYELKPGGYKFSVVLEGSNCKGVTNVSFGVAG